VEELGKHRLGLADCKYGELIQGELIHRENFNRVRSEDVWPVQQPDSSHVEIVGVYLVETMMGGSTPRK
jgi:hypothetical protein